MTMARKWESIICYEDRSGGFHTSRWRLSGIRTKTGGENTDGGVLWLEMSRSGDTVTGNLYKDDGLASGDKVATGSADVSAVDGTGGNAAELSLSEANSSGLSGTFWIHRYTADGTCPVQVALCTDEDLDGLWDGIEDLPGYDASAGMAEYVRLAGEDVLCKVTAAFRQHVGGHGSGEAWFITDAARVHPDLRRIANPGQLRMACAYHALEIALGRSHQRGQNTMYSNLRDYFQQQYDRAMASLSLAFKTGGADARNGSAAAVIRMDRA